MKKIIIILLLLPFLFHSCQYFEKQVPSEEELLQKELQSINWKEVDEFPSVVKCDEIQDVKQRQQCFFQYITQLIQDRLSSGDTTLAVPESDTIDIKFTVYPNSRIAFEPLFPKDSVSYDTIRVDSILKARLVGFPKISPAIKRGIPVKTQFILPIILNKQE